MARVYVTTDDGRFVWALDNVESHHLNGLQCPTNVRGSSLAAGIRRAVQDAEAIQAGRDPERPSEKAIRLAEAARRVHKAEPRSEDDLHCKICGQHVKRVPGGQGTTWVHRDSGAVAAPTP